MFAVRTFMSVAIVALLASALNAQGPQYQPYGAWRGRIHYVDRHEGIRTRVRWGGGLTPVGGQVLMHLGTVAGNVASDYLGGGNGGASRDIDPELISTISGLNTKNEEIRNALNPALAKLGIEQLVAFKTPSIAATSPAASQGVVTKTVVPDAKKRRVRLDELETTNTKYKNELAAAAYKAQATGKSPMITLSVNQQGRLDALNTLITELQPLGLEPPNPPPSGDTSADKFTEQITAVEAIVDKLKEGLSEFGEKAGGLLMDTSEDPEGKLATQIEASRKIFAALKKFKP